MGEKTFTINELKDYVSFTQENEKRKPGYFANFYIEKIFYNEGATVVIWSDKTKTVTKCKKGDTYNQEYALMMCVLKKIYPHKKIDDLFKLWTNNNLFGTVTLKDARKKEVKNGDWK